MKNIVKNQKGIAFIETLIALVLLGIIGTAFMMALSVSSKAIILSDELTTSESLARSQMEFIKNQDYIDYDIESHIFYEEISTPTGYSISFTVVPFDPATGTPYVDLGGGIFDEDDGIQKITVTVAHHGNDIITLEGYKVKR